MIFNTKHEANWEFKRKRKQQLIENKNEAENAKRIPHTYNIGDKVLIRRGTENKYEAPYQGPYTITKVNDNGTVRLKVNNVEDTCLKVNNVEDTYNIRQLTPYLGTESIDHGGECSMRTSRAKRKRN
jgi:putative ribosome biogenesis GTPase RsgA